MSDPLVWAARADWSAAADGTVPLALFDRACWWRDTAIDALRKARMPFRVAFESESSWGVATAIASGLGDGVIAASQCAPGTRVLDRSDGFPRLRTTRVVLLEGSRNTSSAVGAMREAVLARFAAGRPA